MIVTFCGHATLPHPEEVRCWLEEVLSALIQKGADQFYLGGCGAFDRMAAAAVRSQKTVHPQIRSVLVLPYLTARYDASNCDCTLYPPLENVPHRAAIPRRNRFMVDQSDVVVACVIHDWGGAATTLAYARRKGKPVVLYPDPVAIRQIGETVQ